MTIHDKPRHASRFNKVIILLYSFVLFCLVVGSANEETEEDKQNYLATNYSYFFFQSFCRSIVLPRIILSNGWLWKKTLPFPSYREEGQAFRGSANEFPMFFVKSLQERLATGEKVCKLSSSLSVGRVAVIPHLSTDVTFIVKR